MNIYGFVAGKRGNNTPDKHVLNALNGNLSPSMSNLLLGTGGADRRLAGVVHRLFQSRLRELVDAWIASGKTKDGEQPWSRLIPQPELLHDYVRRNPPAFIVAANEPSLLILPPETAEDAAIVMFLQLLDSPARIRLFCCDDCRAYFMRIRTPKKGAMIFRGTYCPKCKSEGNDRTRRTKNSRAQRSRTMVRDAVEAWAQGKPTRRQGKREEWVARKVNDRLPAGAAPIAKNWVTRHTKEIEAEIARRKQHGS